jgi:RNA polymerase sigma-70 factor, ECF subfamily
MTLGAVAGPTCATQNQEIAMTLPPDDVLVARLRSRDEATFAALLDAWSGGMRRLAASYVASSAWADDVVQDTWLAVIENIDTFEGRSSLQHWVYRIVANTAKRRAAREGRSVPSSSTNPGDEPTVDPARFRSADQLYPGHWQDFPAPWPSPEHEALAGEFVRVLQDAVGRLPVRQRAVITLRDVEGFTSEETCSLMDISPANQRVLLHRARTVVRAELEEYLSSSRNDSKDS